MAQNPVPPRDDVEFFDANDGNGNGANDGIFQRMRRGVEGADGFVRGLFQRRRQQQQIDVNPQIGQVRVPPIRQRGLENGGPLLPPDLPPPPYPNMLMGPEQHAFPQALPPQYHQLGPPLDPFDLPPLPRSSGLLGEEILRDLRPEALAIEDQGYQMVPYGQPILFSPHHEEPAGQSITVSGAIPSVPTRYYDVVDDEDKLLVEQDLHDLWEALAELQRQKNRLEDWERRNPDGMRREQLLALENEEIELMEAIEERLPSANPASSSASGSGHAPAHYPPVPLALQQAVSTPAPASKKDDENLNSAWIMVMSESGWNRQNLGIATEELYKRINPNTGSKYTPNDLKGYKLKDSVNLILESERQNNRLQSAGSKSVKMIIKY